MPTWRKLHLKTTESLDINDMPDDFTRLLWLMLPLALDREGRGLDNASWVKAKTMPLRDDVNLIEIRNALTWYSDKGMLIYYSHEDRDYFYIPTFKKYQGNTDREAESDFPPPQDSLSNSRPTHDLLATNSCLDVDVDSEVDIDVDSEESKKPAMWAELINALNLWTELFPDKPQPRHDTKSLRDKWRTRSQEPHFMENWRKALEVSSKSKSLQKESWFNFQFFIKNDSNYQKMLDDWMAWKDEGKPTTKPEKSVLEILKETE